MPSIKEHLDQCDVLKSGKTDLQILYEAHDLLTNPSRWTKGASARDKDGRRVRRDSPDAVAWCVESAVALACNEYGILPPSMIQLLDDAVALIYQTKNDISACEFNELMHHNDIIYLLATAICVEEEKLEMR